MARKKKQEPQRAWEQVLVAEDEEADVLEALPVAETRPLPEADDGFAAEEQFDDGDGFTDLPDEAGDEQTMMPIEEGHVLNDDVPEDAASASPLVSDTARPYARIQDGRVVVRQEGFGRQMKTRIERAVAGEATENLAELHWSPKHRAKISSIETAVDALKRRRRSRPEGLQKWLAPPSLDPASGRAAAELIPANVVSKKILYESSGGYLVQIVYREDGDVKSKYYTLGKTGGRRAALARIKGGAYAPVRPVTEERISRIRTPTARRSRRSTQSGRISTYAIGNEHNVTEIEGIGTVYQARLKELGFYTTDQLRLANAEIIANNTGAAAATVQRWQKQAELMLVKGVGKQLAELLVRAGVESISDLRTTTPAKLANQVKAFRKGRSVRLSGRGLGPASARHLIAEARKMRRKMQPFPKLGPVA